MTTPARNLLGAAAAAAVLALVMVDPTLAGIRIWKWLLALIGLWLWFAAAKR